MGRPPAYIFIVRHGKRLDAAEKQWHMSSPTPYDPPLTYGGWMQSKTVGARIASILREREEDDEAAAAAASASTEPDTTPTRQTKRHYKVVIHSSPFLRCTQTSIAIAAGLASSRSSPTPFERSPSPRSTPGLPSNSVEKSILRLDPFLGEWLSPDYFEHITPPPRSGLMLMTAKAELLRRESYNDYSHIHNRHAPSSSSQLWNASPARGSPLASSTTPEADPPNSLDTLPTMRNSLPRDRSGSVGNLDPRASQKNPSLDPLSPGYIAPVPSYALSTSEPIPRGYVAHARDACVDVDYQWDSSRDDLGWGDGGVLPEEWAAMHQRFRKGLTRLVEWYSTTDNPGDMVTKTVSSLRSKSPLKDCSNGSLSVSDDQDEVENVVVLVSHGAGCNALIGAITHQPVLIDVGMSSITMAERRPEFDQGLDSSIHEQPASLEMPLITKRPTMSDMFEIKLFATTEHLHSAITSPAISRSSSSAGINPHSRYNNGFPSALKEVNIGASMYGGPTAGSRNNSVNASLGSMRRGSPVPTASSQSPLQTAQGAGGITVGSGVSNFSSTRQTRSGSIGGPIGLWMPPTQDDDSAEKLTGTSSFPNSGQENEAANKDDDTSIKIENHETKHANLEPFDSTGEVTSKSGSQSSYGEGHDKFDEEALPRLWAGASNGLWGAPRPPGEAERLRDFSSTKRRWTVNER
ncbi:hypothetical protein M426DRAFT_65651 [Hypoxylon sp. CI-4A]|nr:hypothetical protein M426DRAFT_65651 [Hypoxylon sp. CI-4A]